MGARKANKQGPKSGSGSGSMWSIFGAVIFAIGMICLIYAYTGIKIFLGFRDEMENTESDDGLGAVIGALFIFSAVGVQSLVMAVVIGIIGIILVIVGISTWSVGFRKYYSR